MSIPLGVLIGAAVIGWVALLASSFYVMPTRYRGRIVRRNLVPGILLFIVFSVFSRVTLWYGAVGLLPLALILPIMGRLPEDMPPAYDPAIRRHPHYAAIRRRGRIVGYLMLAAIIAAVVLTAVYVR